MGTLPLGPAAFGLNKRARQRLGRVFLDDPVPMAELPDMTIPPPVAVVKMPYGDVRVYPVASQGRRQSGGAQGSSDTPHSSQPGAAASPGAAVLRKHGGDETPLTPEWKKTLERMK